MACGVTALLVILSALLRVKATQFTYSIVLNIMTVKSVNVNSTDTLRRHHKYYATHTVWNGEVMLIKMTFYMKMTYYCTDIKV